MFGSHAAKDRLKRITSKFETLQAFAIVKPLKSERPRNHPPLSRYIALEAKTARQNVYLNIRG
jgi:hypothetical protein